MKTILESIKKEVNSGKITTEEEAIMLHEASWSNFIDIDRTKRLLNLQIKEKNEEF